MLIMNASDSLFFCRGANCSRVRVFVLKRAPMQAFLPIAKIYHKISNNLSNFFSSDTKNMVNILLTNSLLLRFLYIVEKEAAYHWLMKTYRYFRIYIQYCIVNLTIILLGSLFLLFIKPMEQLIIFN
jgi:hypothetical protein